MNLFRFTLCAVVILLFGSSCANDLPKAQVLDRLRVLALIATTPEVLPGATVTVTPVVSDVRGAGRALSYTVEACYDPGLDYGADVSCSHDTAKVTVGATAVTLTAPRYTQAVTTFNITVPSALFTTAQVDALTQFNGANYLVIFTLTAADGEIEQVFRRIKVSGASKISKNQNPSLTGFKKSDGTAVAALPTEETALLAVAPSTAAEAYSELNTNGSFEARTETLTVSWFASEGLPELTLQAIDSPNTYAPATTPTYSPFVAAVVRDERGGAGVLLLTP